jgi:MFS family permease
MLVFVALIGMRLGGQGLMSHISLSVMSRHFRADRGKALSLTALGFPMAEMVFPFLLALLLHHVPWRVALALSASSLLGLLLALPRFRLETFDAAPPPAAANPATKGQYLRQLVREQPFWMIMVSSFSFSAVVTGFFFYQYLIADAKGWPRPWYAVCFAGYAAVRALFMLFGGPLADRYSARRLFPFYLLPLMLGLLCLELVPGAAAPLLFLLLAGVTAGLSSVLGGAVIAEVYGTARVGQVRSLFSMVMVLSTALTPLVFGALLDAGVSIGTLALSSVAVLAGAALNSLRLVSLPADATPPVPVPIV